MFEHSPRRKPVSRANSQAGATLMEMMMVLAVVSIILGIALPTYNEHRKRVLIAQAQKDIALISQRLETYYALHYRYPEYLVDVGIVDSEDPWGNEYQYLNKDDVDPDTGSISEGEEGEKPRERTHISVGAINSDFDLFSMGENGLYRPNISDERSLDDIVRGSNGDFVDLAEDFE